MRQTEKLAQTETFGRMEQRNIKPLILLELFKPLAFLIDTNVNKSSFPKID